MRRRLLRALAAVAAVTGGALLSGCDYWSTCVHPTTHPDGFTLLLRAALCTDGKPSDGNPIVPQFTILQQSPTGSTGPASAVPSGSLVTFDGTSSYIAAPESKDDPITSFSWDFHGDGQPMPVAAAPYPFEVPETWCSGGSPRHRQGR
jgi:hypothetical protein